MEHRKNAVLHEVRDECGTRLEVCNFQVEHVRVVAAFRRNVGEANVARIFEALQAFAVGVPAGHAVVVNLLRVLEFGVQVCRIQFARQVTGTELDPGIFIDFAADMKWDYALVDAGWYLRDGKNVKIGPDGLVVRDGFDVPELVEYGRAKGVGLLLWIDWPDLIQVDPRKTLKRCSDWGVAGVKIDHMNSHSQETVASLTETVRAAAEYKLLVNFHGMYEPTGLERTLPNQITREGIYGNEYFRGRAISQTLVAALPYTRCLIGPGDYTPGGFRNTHLETYRPLKEQTGANASTEVVGTRAHELALCMLLDSPLRCLCDLPRVYKDQPGLEYLRALPATWDDTVALDGAIGEFYVAARRSGDDWYVSGITNEQARAFAVPLDFLDEGASYDAAIYADAPESDADAAAIDITSKTVVKGDVLNFTAVRDGGWNAVLKRKR